MGQTLAVSAERQDARPAALDGSTILRLGGITLQLGLLVLLIHQFQLESRTFYSLALLTLGGFVVHSLLPLRYRLPFFLVLSLAGIGLAFRAGGLWIVGLGCLLITIAHLPIRFRWRLAVLAVAALALTALRAGWVGSPMPLEIWPVLGSMFMFRLALYLYTLRHERQPFNLWRSLSYFFLLPNVCFPLFPIVDYKTFTQTYYDEEAFAIYQRGARWMFRGLIHLLLYRYIYYNLTLDATELATLGHLMQFIITTFLLYLRVSGQFHLIVGMLHLFGFRLPETHHRYLLSRNFTDLWRRINIYWKDCMMKLVYYPSFFRLRRFGNLPALVLSTAIVFVVSWALHSYQWFWLRGDFLFSAPDMLFWAILGALVTVTAWHEAKRSRQRPVERARWNAGLGIRIVATISALTILWSLWSADSVTGWLGMWKVALVARPRDYLLLLLLLGSGVGLAGWNWDARHLPARTDRQSDGAYLRQALSGSGLTLGVILIGSPSVYSRFPLPVAAAIASVETSHLNRHDALLQQRGYYEKLDNVSRFNTQLWEVYRQRPAEDGEIENADGPYQPRADWLRFELAPSKAILFKQVPFRTNRWGMRDQEYARLKPEGTYRIAILGASDVMGLGVADGEPFESVLEKRLNQLNDHRRFDRYEVLNFAVGGYSLLHQVVQLERVFGFQPDAVIFTSHAIDRHAMLEHLARVTREGREVPVAEVRSFLEQAGVKASMDREELMRRLLPFGDSLLALAYRQMIAVSAAHRIPTLLVHMRLPTSETPDDPRALTLAREAGHTIVDLTDVYQGFDERTLRLSDWDKHPTSYGHRLIGLRLYDELMRRADYLGLAGPPDSRESASRAAAGPISR